MKNVNIYAFADEAGASLEEQIAALQRNELKGLEIRNVGGTNVSDLALDTAREIRKRMDDAGLITWSIGSPIGKIDIEKDDFAAHCDKLRHTLEVADVLGAKNIRMFSFYIPQDKDAADYRNEVIERLGKMLELAKGTGVALCHENEKGIYGDIGTRCNDLLTTLPELHGIFDPANFVQSNDDSAAAWKLLRGKINYMHIKDSLEDGSVVPAGQGAGAVKQIVSEFIADGGKDFTIEPHLMIFSGLAELEREGEESLIGKYGYPNPNAAFDAAVTAFKGLL